MQHVCVIMRADTGMMRHSRRDGEQHNLTWNCGVEGPTTSPAIASLRARQVSRTFIITARQAAHLADAMCSTYSGLLHMATEAACCDRHSTVCFL